MKDKEVIGYKMFENDWTCRGFQYEIGKTYEYDGKIKLCESGFHFCKKLEDCFENYPLVQWNKIAKVKATGEIIKGEDKCVTDCITILEEINFNEISKYISNGINFSNGINRSEGIHRSNGINGSHGINWSKGINCSNGINFSNGINRSEGIHRSNGINEGKGIHRSNGINESNGINCSNGINRSYGLLKCSGLSQSMFCVNKTFQYYFFNKKINKKRYEEINKRFLSLLKGWSPKFNNLKGLYLKSGEKWEYTPIPLAKKLSIKEAWEGMPKEAIDYLKSLPEFDAEIFKEITGIEV